MKAKNKLYLLAIGAAALSLTVTTSVGQTIDSIESLKNRAVAASPRAKEVFPWLARGQGESICCPTDAKATSALTEVQKNRALAASPRMIEVFPELVRSPRERAAGTGIDQLTEVTRNRALAASPRMIEQFPELARGQAATKSFEIAPLK